MKYKQLFEKAYARLVERYSGEYSALDPILLSRFYQEKRILEKHTLYMRYLDFSNRVREAAMRKDEHVLVKGTAGASFIAYLLGATDLNPLPRHTYCPHCHTIKFTGSGTPFDKAPLRCSCGAEFETNGHNLPFVFNLNNILSERIQLGVSYAFFEEVKAMICDEMWDKAIVTLSDDATSPTWFCFLDKATNTSGEYALNGNQTIFADTPRITLIPEKTLDKYRELEQATGLRMKDIGVREERIAFFQFMKRDIRGIPHLDNDLVRDIWDAIHPQSYNDLLKLIGFAHSTNVWKNNAEPLFHAHKMSLREIPAYREDLYEMIRERLFQNGIYDDGLAYEVADKAARGYYARMGGVDEDMMLALLDLGFSMDFVFFLSEIQYMSTKVQGSTYLREAIAMMFYKTTFAKQCDEIR